MIPTCESWRSELFSRTCPYYVLCGLPKKYKYRRRRDECFSSTVPELIIVEHPNSSPHLLKRSSLRSKSVPTCAGMLPLPYGYVVTYPTLEHFGAFFKSALIRVVTHPEPYPRRWMPPTTVVDVKHPVPEKENWRQSVIREHFREQSSKVPGKFLCLESDSLSEEKLSQSSFSDSMAS
jgi:hypothetical protein